jgi:hypothetical protein
MQFHNCTQFDECLISATVSFALLDCFVPFHVANPEVHRESAERIRTVMLMKELKNVHPLHSFINKKLDGIKYDFVIHCKS